MLYSNFIGEYGSHVICREHHYYTKGYSYQSYSNSTESAEAYANEYSGSFSSRGDDGFSGNVSAWYSHSSSSKYATNQQHSGEKSATSEYEINSLYCIGEVYMSDGCGDMLGHEDSAIQDVINDVVDTYHNTYYIKYTWIFCWNNMLK